MTIQQSGQHPTRKLAAQAFVLTLMALLLAGLISVGLDVDSRTAPAKPLYHEATLLRSVLTLATLSGLVVIALMVIIARGWDRYRYWPIMAAFSLWAGVTTYWVSTQQTEPQFFDKLFNGHHYRFPLIPFYTGGNHAPFADEEIGTMDKMGEGLLFRYCAEPFATAPDMRISKACAIEAHFTVKSATSDEAQTEIAHAIRALHLLNMASGQKAGPAIAINPNLRPAEQDYLPDDIFNGPVARFSQPGWPAAFRQYRHPDAPYSMKLTALFKTADRLSSALSQWAACRSIPTLQKDIELCQINEVHNGLLLQYSVKLDDIGRWPVHRDALVNFERQFRTGG